MTIVEVVNAILRECQDSIFGCRIISLAFDSKKVGVWDQNLLMERYIRYHGRGIMIYWYIARKSALTFSQLKSYSLSEVAHMIQGGVHHFTDMDVQKNCVDSHERSIVRFSFFYMWGFYLLPRIKAIRIKKFYHSEDGRLDDYQNLQNSMLYINTLLLQFVSKNNQWVDKLTNEDKRAINFLFFEYINSYRLFLLDLNDLILINSIPFKKIEVYSGRNM